MDPKFYNGWAFQNLCYDKHGNQWGEHKNMEELMCLGLATGLVQFCLPREEWAVFPGGLPYILFVKPD